MPAYRVRVEGKNTSINLPDESTVSDMLGAISKNVGCLPQEINIKVGFPPKISTASPNEKLSTLRWHREALIVTIVKAETNDKQVLLHKIPADNSCLFNAVSYLMQGANVDGKNNGDGADLRELCAAVIASDPSKYNDSILGKSNAQYCEWLLNPLHWGGGIEIEILSNHFQVQIACCDIETSAVMFVGSHKQRIYLAFSGIHYDALVATAVINSESDHWTCPTCTLDNINEVTSCIACNNERPTKTQPDATKVFLAKDEAMEAAVKAWLIEARDNHQYTNTLKFALRCSVCKAGLVGQAEARDHAMETSHTQFEEYKA